MYIIIPHIEMIKKGLYNNRTSNY